MESSYLCEFAGYSITPDRIAKGLKWRDVSDVSFFDHLRMMGKSALPFLTRDQRAVARLFSQLPKQLGGLGWSDGNSLDEFFKSEKGQALMLASLMKEENFTIWEDLHVGLHREIWQFQHLPSYIPGLAERYMDGETWRQVSLTDHFRGLVPQKSPTQPTKLVASKESHRYPSDDGYYLISRKPTDPRPSIQPLVARYLDITESLSLDNDIDRDALLRFKNRERSKPRSKVDHRNDLPTRQPPNRMRR
jgi:hypothetical protein